MQHVVMHQKMTVLKVQVQKITSDKSFETHSIPLSLKKSDIVVNIVLC